MVNQGTIGAILSGGNFAINGGAFVNKGLINVNNGDVLTIVSSNFSNSGTVNVVNASTLNIGQGGSWSSTGKINVTDSTVNLRGTVTQAELNAITRAGGLVDVAGTMDLAGGTLNVGGTTAIGGLLLTGTIKNGTVHDGGLGLQFGTGFFPAPTLDGVIYQGALDLSEPSARLTVLDAFTVTGTSGTGPGTINLTGNNSNLTLTGSRTLDNATVRIGNASLAIANPGSTTAVTFGPNLTIKQAGRRCLLQRREQQHQRLVLTVGQPAQPGQHFWFAAERGAYHQRFRHIHQCRQHRLQQWRQPDDNSRTLSPIRPASPSATVSSHRSPARAASTTRAWSLPATATSISISGGYHHQPWHDVDRQRLDLGISGFSSFANTGSLNLAAGATLNIGSSNAPWSSTGKITATNATVNLDGVVTQGEIAAITRVGGVIDIAGTLNNTRHHAECRHRFGVWRAGADRHDRRWHHPRHR